VNEKGEKEGLALLSRHPIRSSGYHVMARKPNCADTNNRIVLYGN